MREMLKLVEAIAPCVLWCDEIEKALGGHASSAQSDSGVTLSMVGTLLTWMQEHRSQVLTVMTANDHSKLPAELTRAGRIDEQFFVDIPNLAERAEIGAVHLRKYKASPELAPTIAALSDNWTGAEIEQLVRSAARRSRGNITAAVLTECAENIRPITRTRPVETAELREWGKKTLRLANTPAEAMPVSGRKIGPSKASTINPKLN